MGATEVALEEVSARLWTKLNMSLRSCSGIYGQISSIQTSQKNYTGDAIIIVLFPNWNYFKSF